MFRQIDVCRVNEDPKRDMRVQVCSPSLGIGHGNGKRIVLGRLRGDRRREHLPVAGRIAHDQGHGHGTRLAPFRSCERPLKLGASAHCVEVSVMPAPGHAGAGGRNRHGHTWSVQHSRATDLAFHGAGRPRLIDRRPDGVEVAPEQGDKRGQRGRCGGVAPSVERLIGLLAEHFRQPADQISGRPKLGRVMSELVGEPAITKADRVRISLQAGRRGVSKENATLRRTGRAMRRDDRRLRDVGA
jgi:hypothetical protein